MRIPDDRLAVNAVPVCSTCGDDDVLALVRAEVIDGHWSVARDASPPGQLRCRRCGTVGPLRWSDALADRGFFPENGTWWARRADHALHVVPTGESRGYRLSLLARWRSGPELASLSVLADDARIACDVAAQWGSSLAHGPVWNRTRHLLPPPDFPARPPTGRVDLRPGEASHANDDIVGARPSGRQARPRPDGPDQMRRRRGERTASPFADPSPGASSDP